MPDRPSAVKIKTEICRTGTLGRGASYFRTIQNGSIPLFLGLGPDPLLVSSIFPPGRGFYLECPELENQLGPAWKKTIPSSLTRINPEEIGTLPLNDLRIVLYLPGYKYFPGFWTRILARIRLKRLKVRTGLEKSDRVMVFGTERSLLVPEICWELDRLGFKPVLAAPDAGPDQISSMLARYSPCLALSINLQGLDPLGENHALFAEMDVPVALWMVDNPFLLLTKLKAGYWTKTHILITDHWFRPALKELGASSVHHLPLAAAPGFFNAPQNPDSDLRDKVVFIGRSGFPGKNSFFAAARRHPRLQDMARELLKKGFRADFSWWTKQLDPQYWPGNQIRDPGLGADETGLVWKKMCLEHLARQGSLVIHGDQDWRNHLSQGIELRPEVDFYGPLGSIYASARYVLNLTNMLLPCGLTQRHFDVWAAGGFLLTDFTCGLEIFPSWLVRETSFSTPEEIPDLIARLDSSPELKVRIKNEFRKLVTEKHTYKNRVQDILKIAGIKPGSS